VAAIVLGLVGAGGVAANPVDSGVVDCFTAQRGPVDDLSDQAECIIDCMMVGGCLVSCEDPDCIPDCGEPCDVQPEAPVCGAAAPVTGVITGNGNSWFQLYKDPLGNLVASWMLQTNNLNNGADEWVFGLEWGAPGPSGTGMTIARSRLFEDQLGVCRPLGEAGLGPTEFYVDAGAGGFSGSSSCSISFSWEIGAGVSITGPSGSASLGGSLECGAGTTFDSESLLRGGGSTNA